MKYIIVTGGVISGLGKGITASSIGLLLKYAGLNVTAIKIDPYLNIDAGTMSPYEHGECYVLADGSEVDLDLGNYERFLNIELTGDHSITTGKVYNNVLTKERNGDYLGKTVQIIPHITNEISRLIEQGSQIQIDGCSKKKPDVCIIELGGTIGDIEGLSFVEALRQMNLNLGQTNQFCFVHLSLIIDNGEYKTKPTQHSVAKLRELGISPDMLILRCPDHLDQAMTQKLELMCHIQRGNIIENRNVPNIYYVPQLFHQQGVHKKIGEILGLKLEDFDFSATRIKNIIRYFDSSEISKTIVIGIAGKYLNNNDTYLSLIRAIYHAAFHHHVKIKIKWLDVEKPVEELLTEVDMCDGIIIPGGFGVRGVSGKLAVANICRSKGKPMLGICLGMQIIIVEFMRSVVGLPDAASTEWNINTAEETKESTGSTVTKNPVIQLLPGQTYIKGGTMRLGNYKSHLHKGTKTKELYGNKDFVLERHRHRYEVNNEYVSKMEQHGLKVSGINKKHDLVEIVELVEHPFYVGCQFHPEYKTRMDEPAPLFVGLVGAILKK